MSQTTPGTTAACVLFLVGACLVHSTAAHEVDFERQVLPILKAHCIDCHGQETQESGLRLDSELAALRGGESGETVIVPGRSEASHLIERLTTADEAQRMPPESAPLSDAEVRTLRAWIASEDRWRPLRQALAARRTLHWSFQPVGPTGPERGVDEFIHRKLHAEGLRASPRASRRTLIRRLSLVMHGLPPAPARVDAFCADERPDAWPRLIDEFLASPRYGERGATAWLDLVRFGETHGFETNRERPTAWHFRDWVIQSLNDDKPYDQFVVEQLAGDQVGAGTGTGFLVAGPYDLVKGQDPDLRLIQRQDELADIVNTAGTAFLGLTIGCARCHNHKFDPIPQGDYYAIQAVFAGVQHGERVLAASPSQQRELDQVGNEIGTLRRELSPWLVSRPRQPVSPKGNVDSFDPVTVRFLRFTIEQTNGAEPCIDELEVYSGKTNVALAATGARASSAGDFVHPLHKLEHINDGRYGNPRSWIARQRSGGWVMLEFPEPVLIDRVEWARDREGRYADRLAIAYRIEGALTAGGWRLLSSSADRQPYQAGTPVVPEYDLAGLSGTKLKHSQVKLNRLRVLEQRRRRLQERPRMYAGTFTQPGPTHRLYRGEPNAPREQVSPDTLTVLGRLDLPANAPEGQRRLAFARSIVNPDNPLIARVIVNRLWQMHFGTGLVDTASDFGANGTRPSHPQLLDWLALELIESDWSLKHIHRTIVRSQTWQQQSHPVAAAERIDGDSRLCWRFPPRRLEAEAIRDSILAVTGVLDEGSGGPGFSAFEVQQENVRHYFPLASYGPRHWRRMVYMTRVRQERDSVFGVFDCPDGSQVVPRRSRSTTPLQALNLLNSTFVNQQASLLADRLRRERPGSTAEQVQQAWRLCFGRRPEPAELREAIAFVSSSGLDQFSRALLNANEFVFVP